MGKSISNLICVTQVGLDLAKNVFQVHAIDAQGVVIVAKPVRGYGDAALNSTRPATSPLSAWAAPERAPAC
jgi:hypothetical protein